MARGSDGKAPTWALVAIAVLTVLLVVGVVTTLNRTPEDPVSQAEVDRMDAAAAADDAEDAAAAAPPAVPRGEAGVARVVFAGDSLTYGLFASTEEAGYRPQVVAALTAGGPVEASRGGQTGNQVATVTESIEFPANTNLAVLALGTNDLGKTEPDQLAEDYRALVDKVKTSAPDARIICLGAWTNVDGERNYGPSIEGPCTEGGGTYLPLWELFEDPANRGPAGREAFGGTGDDFHPNDAGYKAIADLVLTVVGP